MSTFLGYVVMIVGFILLLIMAAGLAAFAIGVLAFFGYIFYAIIVGVLSIL